MTVFKTIRATPVHAALIAQMQKSCFPDSWNALEMTNILETPTCVGLLCLDRQQSPVGFLLAYVNPGESEVLSIGVPPAFRQRGIGEYLLRTLCQICRDKNNQRLFLEVNVHNQAAISLYRQQGFTQIGNRPNYYKNHDGSRQDALIFRKMIF